MSSIANLHKSRSVIDADTTPVTVFTGFLGVGKTTIIIDLLKRVSPKYNIVLLKNEFGDAETDSALARESHIKVTEMTNGCLCCVLVGQMKRALEEMKAKYCPDRIIIETSGSAFPAPIAWQIREMESSGFHLDAILTVIDCINFCGYEDTSYTARMQAQYTDLILLNKWSHITERQLDIVVDHINELNTDTPKIKVGPDGSVDPEMIFGLDTTLFALSERPSVVADLASTVGSAGRNLSHHANEVDLVEIRRNQGTSLIEEGICSTDFIAFLVSLPAEDVYRVKGIVRLVGSVTDSETPPANSSRTDESALYIVNHAFGRYTLTCLTDHAHQAPDVLVCVTILGSGLRTYLPHLLKGFMASELEATVQWAQRPE
ncbi:hypothetical protein GGH94_001700 [Coemansia aciculifera]|uniref:CobW/HypB/UreG nucleotide-binding domain-containing protein n=1 Tax=Coemansia aciculifera TaxID=417176 RepID=A0A9W8IKB6_9FUNG|nr:hypothetical protein GGH94_001700 [Coemansia aciculifera]